MTARGVLLALTLAAAPPLVAQEVTLRFRPVDGMRVHRLFQVHTRVTEGGVAAASREVAYLGGMSQVVTLGPGGSPVVHLSFDSLRARTRAGGQPWQESPLVGGDTLWVQLRYDERMRPHRRTPAADWSAELLTTLVTGLPGFEHPSAPVVPGGAWQVAVPVGAPQSATDELRVVTTVTLDSLVARSRDTLAYLSVAGALAPTVRSTERGPVRYAATVGGQLVWSTAWGNVVSAAVRTRVEAVPQASARASAPLTWERTIRTTVRP